MYVYMVFPPLNPKAPKKPEDRPYQAAATFTFTLSSSLTSTNSSKKLHSDDGLHHGKLYTGIHSPWLFTRKL